MNAARLDATALDADPSPIDAGLDDVGPSDALADARALDAEVPDMELVDMEAPDIEAPDMALPDLALPDMASADAGPPDWIIEGPRARIEAGWFIRGSRLREDPADEKPQRAIFISTYDIDREEIPLAAWAACVEAGVCEAPTEDPLCTWPLRADEPRLPVNCMTRAQARVYCQALGGDLPTEAQWARAARGDCTFRERPECEQGRDDVVFPWMGAERTCRQARSRLCLNWEEGPEPVWFRSPSGDSIYGLSNTAGNVAEWVLDAYESDFYAFEHSPEVDPVGRWPLGPGVVRGGHYGSNVTELRIADRRPFDPSQASPEVGLRCAFPAPGAEGAAPAPGSDAAQIRRFPGIIQSPLEADLALWRVCHRQITGADAEDTYEDIAQTCDGALTLFACRRQGHPELQIAAMGATEALLTPTGPEGRLHNEVRFWFGPGAGLGFAPAPEGAPPGTCDPEGVEPFGLCGADDEGLRPSPAFTCGPRSATPGVPLERLVMTR